MELIPEALSVTATPSLARSAAVGQARGSMGPSLPVPNAGNRHRAGWRHDVCGHCPSDKGRREPHWSVGNQSTEPAQERSGAHAPQDLIGNGSLAAREGGDPAHIPIVVLTLIAVIASLSVPTVGDKGELPDSLPNLFLPNVPLNLDTLRIIFPYALAKAFVGLLESLMTAKLTPTPAPTRAANPGARAPRTSSPASSAAWVAAR